MLLQVAYQVLGNGFYIIFYKQPTCLILLIAANTCFTGFPILDYLTEQLQRVGDRFAFRNRITMLTALSAILFIIFYAKVSRVIPLYAFGVFIALHFVKLDWLSTGM